MADDTPARDAPRLLVVLADPLSGVIDKGEVTPRYYNPAGLFGHVDFVLLNDDRPDPVAVQRMCGDAVVSVHNLALPRRLWWRTLGWLRWPSADARAAFTALVQRLRPDVIRCHGAHIDAGLATACGRDAGVPVLVSLHNRPDVVIGGGLRERLHGRAALRLAGRALRAADAVVAVYRSQLPLLERLGVQDVELVYNAVAPDGLAVKQDYRLCEPPSLVSVGRQIPGKDVSALLRALARTPGARLTLVGDGPLNGQLRTLTRELQLEDRVVFVTAMDNRELCESLATHDLFVTHNEHPGVPKAVLEPLLAGLPVLLNRAANEPVPELDEDICLMVENSAEGYAAGMRRLLDNTGLRERLGRAARERALQHWDPALCEQRVAAIYRRLVDTPRRAPSR